MRSPRESTQGTGGVDGFESASAELLRIAARVEEGERITPQEGLYLHEHADLSTLGRLADLVRARKHPAGVVTYIVDRNINPTNVCITDCGFCAFYRRPGHAQAYVLPREEIIEKVRETAELGGRQVLIQGGHHPHLKTAWWCDLFADLRERFPSINLHALSAPELDHLAKLDKRPVEEVLADLIEAGLGSVPGAGAEMLVDRVRSVIAPRKTGTDRWLEIHGAIHAAGLRSSATMMFGHIETPAERIEHLMRLREQQEKSGGFTAFICWNMQPDGVPEAHKYPPRTTHGVYLRVQALSRIFLDNFDHMQTSYVTQGTKIGQVALHFGCDDFGGTMLEENVVSAAGCFNLESIQTIERTIERAGFRPLRRNTWYGIVDERFEGPEADRGPQTREQGAVGSSRAAAGLASAGAPSRASARPTPTPPKAGASPRARLQRQAESAGLGEIAAKVFSEERLSLEDGLALYRARDLHALGALANFARERQHGNRAYFNVNQHINYTNYCNKFCKFCSFDRLPGQAGAYLLTPEEVAAKIRAQAHEPITEVHMVAGVWPKIPYSYYLDLLRAVKATRPSIHIKAFTMVELDQIAKVARKPLADVLEELKQAGLDSCPGGGAEVFAERIHRAGYPSKISGERWLAIAREVHRAGLRSNCTMLHGHIETAEEKVDHLDRLRRLQDETGGFQTYIPLSFHNANNEWSHLHGPTAVEELREIAVGRLMLDNIPHIKAYWILMELSVAGVCLSFGADDIDGTVVEEHIYHDAGARTPQRSTRAELMQVIRDAQRIPVERDTLYRIVAPEGAVQAGCSEND
jgi:aminodeoxyfutalosine synthase